MSPIGTRHTGGVNRLNALFTRRLGRRAVVSVQNPIILDDYSEPQPDLTILAARSDYYSGAHPRPPDVLLAIEVSDSSVSYDRSVKLGLYARKHLRELWLIDIPGRRLDVYRRPTAIGLPRASASGPRTPRHAAGVSAGAFPGRRYSGVSRSYQRSSIRVDGKRRPRADNARRPDRW